MCSFCGSYYKLGPEMDNHQQSMHPKEWEDQRLAVLSNYVEGEGGGGGGSRLSLLFLTRRDY